ncbi:hypothetical protein BDK51DRAFT_47812 [Blyttiomyces helicus]|uniref:Uncharacterized protein n=1 Tax=Blyttiomyces helicus TaxID=388810 RepID=A0A4P9VVC5_9FUNG|nr:hypothetical protein BDK51DRAFT_47812 [Blyttiomyces helicus]|eukprot:RKO83072.1 hypothetical protein BDK51DRAFT_47812 [Blyttiomyces helicus]
MGETSFATPSSEPHPDDFLPSEAEAENTNMDGDPDEDAGAPLDRQPLDESPPSPSDNGVSLMDDDKENTKANMEETSADDEPLDTTHDCSRDELPPYKARTHGCYEVGVERAL